MVAVKPEGIAGYVVEGVATGRCRGEWVGCHRSRKYFKPKYVIRACGKVSATSEQIAADRLEGVAGYVKSWYTARCRWEWADCRKSRVETKDHDAF